MIKLFPKTILVASRDLLPLQYELNNCNIPSAHNAHYFSISNVYESNTSYEFF